MNPTLLILFSVSTVTLAADYGHHFGNAFSTGPVATGSFIRESNTTLILPKTNSPQDGNLALWPGMGTSDGDLIQALVIPWRTAVLGVRRRVGSGVSDWRFVD